MNDFFEVVVSFEVDTGKNGKTKKVRENFLVVAETVTEAERNTYALLEGESDFTIISARQSNIKAVKLDAIAT